MWCSIGTEDGLKLEEGGVGMDASILTMNAELGDKVGISMNSSNIRYFRDENLAMGLIKKTGWLL